MKKVVFILNDLERGGIPRVTLNLLTSLDNRRVIADVICANPRGIFLNEMKHCPQVRKFLSSWLLRALTCNWKREDWPFRYVAIVVKLIRYAVKATIGYDLLSCCIHKTAKQLSKNHYDWLVATNEALCANIANAIPCRRAVWIHNDYAHDSSAKLPNLRKTLSAFERIVCVAEHARKSLCDCFPELSKHACTIYNLVNVEDIVTKASELTREQCYPDWKGFTIVSIGRYYDTQKRFSVIPEICSELKKRGLNFRWYLIGNGSPAETAILKSAIQAASTGESFVLLGEKANPYPYLKWASLFAIPSAYETYPTVVNEAKTLGVQVLSTDFKGVTEVLEDADGIITPISNFVDAIERIIQQSKRGKQVAIRHLTDFASHNQKALDDFYKMIDA